MFLIKSWKNIFSFTHSIFVILCESSKRNMNRSTKFLQLMLGKSGVCVRGGKGCSVTVNTFMPWDSKYIFVHLCMSQIPLLAPFIAHLLLTKRRCGSRIYLAKRGCWRVFIVMIKNKPDLVKHGYFRQNSWFCQRISCCQRLYCQQTQPNQRWNMKVWVADDWRQVFALLHRRASFPSHSWVSLEQLS